MVGHACGEESRPKMGWHPWRRRWQVCRRSPSLKIAGAPCRCGAGVGNDARKWCRWSTRPIFDCRETVAGVCRRPRTVCETVGERRCDSAGCLLTLGIGPHRWARTYWRHRCERFSTVEKRWCRAPCTVCESTGERRRDGVGRLPTARGDTRARMSG